MTNELLNGAVFINCNLSLSLALISVMKYSKGVYLCGDVMKYSLLVLTIIL